MQYLNKAENTSRKYWDEFLCIEIRSSLFEFRRFDLSAQRAVYFVFSFSFFNTTILLNMKTNAQTSHCSDLSYSVLGQQILLLISMYVFVISSVFHPTWCNFVRLLYNRVVSERRGQCSFLDILDYLPFSCREKSVKVRLDSVFATCFVENSLLISPTTTT